MTPTASGLTPELIEQVRKLSPDDRDRLFELVFDPAADREAWRAEIARRIEAVRNGTMKTYSVEETMAYLRTVVNESRQP